MSDIIIRLQSIASQFPGMEDLIEAADEIKRLRETASFLDKQVVQNDWRILSLLRILAAHGIEVDK